MARRLLLNLDVRERALFETLEAGTRENRPNFPTQEIGQVECRGARCGFNLRPEERPDRVFRQRMSSLPHQYGAFLTTLPWVAEKFPVFEKLRNHIDGLGFCENTGPLNKCGAAIAI